MGRAADGGGGVRQMGGGGGVRQTNGSCEDCKGGGVVRNVRPRRRGDGLRTVRQTEGRYEVVRQTGVG
jgi:hypothetical protein